MTIIQAMRESNCFWAVCYTDSIHLKWVSQTVRSDYLYYIFENLG